MLNSNTNTGLPLVWYFEELGDFLDRRIHAGCCAMHRMATHTIHATKYVVFQLVPARKSFFALVDKIARNFCDELPKPDKSDS